ncbi:class II fructose-bisphosphate aldolase family protein [Enterococcus casseliflavus]|uniref:class II fructose-bisphosphate aldolase n=1 Tax=Enterococcus casseliflavus TaxID=37734 RepID=UPI000EAC5F76|nr:class II fructose-bisphosphate aldolase [Enterococcus casseliflavus]AYJ44384.1 class II fructose-bisphosphate aldolase [Enterococcus casseliflavus]MBS5814393.1 class II fructose-bisphosphate aldolase [Enterococcus casseliflavus]MCD4962980.1 class II fructose-bisphosphate aldolase [Enterococcus casseliflavus]MDT2980372.1 class II fructose-bisphosphate aldolase family protein [Enterococcus casseliflavus]MDU3373105.1 class II fructose-bisphosphate aldolase [Enterococcus casseliflavus]
MYVSMKEMLQKANRENYAVMAINCFNMETAKAVIDAAAESHAPIIVDLLQDHLKTHLDHRYLTQPIIRMAENVNVEVAINLDHGQDIAFVKQCLHEGFSSVMMDASMHPLEKNIAITKEIVQFAQAYNASVEAEVGDMGAVAGDQYTSDAMYTDPEEAIHFIRATGVDCLALSYGSSHGDYPEGYRPAFRFDIVQTIKEATDLPLVLHGGSGAGRENILRSVALGINKINVGADFMKAQRNALHQQLDACPESDYPTLIHQTIEAGKAVVKEYIELSGSKNKSL